MNNIVDLNMESICQIEFSNITDTEHVYSLLKLCYLKNDVKKIGLTKLQFSGTIRDKVYIKQLLEDFLEGEKGTFSIVSVVPDKSTVFPSFSKRPDDNGLLRPPPSTDPILSSTA